MKEADQQIREYIATKYPNGIIDRHGWPGPSLVGEEGANAAFLIAQHADREPEFQQLLLPLLSKVVENGQAKLLHLACLTDRVHVQQGKPQIYGTQMNWINGEPVPYSIEDSANVNIRRKEVGLGPLSEYIDRMKNYTPHHRKPTALKHGKEENFESYLFGSRSVCSIGIKDSL